VIRRHVALEVEAIEQRLLRHRSLAHHRLVSRIYESIESAPYEDFNPEFFNKIGELQSYISRERTYQRGSSSLDADVSSAPASRPRIKIVGFRFPFSTPLK
jgi:hypothetical protein